MYSLYYIQSYYIDEYYIYLIYSLIIYSFILYTLLYIHHTICMNHTYSFHLILHFWDLSKLMHVAVACLSSVLAVFYHVSLPQFMYSNVGSLFLVLQTVLF